MLTALPARFAPLPRRAARVRATKRASASTPKQWERAVKEVLSWDMDERRAAWRKGYDWLLEHKTIQTHIHKWASCL